MRVVIAVTKTGVVLKCAAPVGFIVNGVMGLWVNWEKLTICAHPSTHSPIHSSTHTQELTTDNYSFNVTPSVRAI